MTAWFWDTVLLTRSLKPELEVLCAGGGLEAASAVDAARA